MEMDKAREILRQHYEVGLSQRDIAESVKVSLGTVSGVLAKARAAGISYPVPMSNKELGSILYPPKERGGESGHAEPDMEYVHREMQKKGVTLTLLWEEYKTEHADGLMFTQFCERYRIFRKSNDVYMRKVYKAGERAMVDWAGETMKYTDAAGEEHKVYLFVATLPASSYLYAEPFRDMGQQAWIDAHIHAFEYFGGAPRIIVPDNTKTAIIKTDLYDPVGNRTYAEMARHYGAAIVPARVRKPKDKAPVETGVQIVERRIIAKLRNRQFHDFGVLWEAVQGELENVNAKPFQKLQGSRYTVFKETEKSQLRPLPPTRYECAEWKQVRASMDYHVQYDGHFYSIPYQYAGKRLDLRATANIIEVFYDRERIASHLCGFHRHARYTTLPEHMPSNHRAMADWTPERFDAWARKFGPVTREYIRFLMNKREHPEQAFKTCAGILRMGDALSVMDMENLCRMALEQNVFSYKYFSLLLKRMNAMMDKKVSPPIQHENLRGGGYYGGEANA
jgi:transposase